MKQCGIRRSDEMEKAVSYRSMRIVYPLTILALLAYCVWQFVATGELPHILAAIVFASAALYFILWISFIRFLVPKEDSSDEQ